MSIAVQQIAGCSPIAGGGCVAAPLVTEFWGPTSVVFVPDVGIGVVTDFWGPTAQVFSGFIIVDSEQGEGDCVLVPPHDNYVLADPAAAVAYADALEDDDEDYIMAPSHDNYIYACALYDDAFALPRNDSVVAPGLQECHKEAA